MSSPQRPSKPASRWAFLSQAVASVESGLDRILADEDETAKKPPAKNVKNSDGAAIPRVSSDLTRNESPPPTNDRLQARLAQAMVKKGPSRVNSPAPISNTPSRSETPLPGSSEAETGERILELGSHEAELSAGVADVDGGPASVEKNILHIETPTSDSAKQSMESRQRSKELSREPSSRVIENARSSYTSTRGSQERPSLSSFPNQSVDPDVVLLDAQLQHEKSLAALQEEINGYLERIDALQRNIQILTKDTLQNAKDIKQDDEATGHEKRLAEKDEKIALLIEEGTKLTKGEMQYRSVIKKLRAQATTITKDQEAAQRRAVKAEQAFAVLEARVLNAEAEAKAQNDRIVSMCKSSADHGAIARERDALAATLSDVRAQLSKANARAEDAEAKAASDKLQLEQKRTAELEDDLKSAKVEKELMEDKLKRQIEDLKQSLQLEKDQARQMETEMLAEQASLEGKLEAFRVRAEEASTGDLGDSQAKALRQIETLQSQYAAASQNWQGIESTLLTRITALEKERDEVVSRETDLRRKLKDATTRARNASSELEEAQHSLHTLQDQQADESAEVLRMRKRVEQAEKETALSHKELEEQRLRMEKETNKRIEEERVKWMASLNAMKLDSPSASVRRGLTTSMMDGLVSPSERPHSRRSSVHPFSEFQTLSPQTTMAASIRTNGHSAIPETPSITVADDADDFFANIPATPASGTRADSITGRNVHDVISASAGGSGPSVQLVERMSANVRRLESEKAASKDEINRLSAQRDEARQQVVDLMREVEQKRTTESRLASLEKEHKQLGEKHRATLELLGEKTELVDELKADILDVKQMYRHLADTMGRS